PRVGREEFHVFLAQLLPGHAALEPEGRPVPVAAHVECRADRQVAARTEVAAVADREMRLVLLVAGGPQVAAEARAPAGARGRAAPETGRPLPPSSFLGGTA